MAAAKKADAVRELGGSSRGEPVSVFHSYDLDAMGIPVDARPLRGEHHAGKHGYTIRSPNGAALWLKIQEAIYFETCFTHKPFLISDLQPRSGN